MNNYLVMVSHSCEMDSVSTRPRSCLQRTGLSVCCTMRLTMPHHSIFPAFDPETLTAAQRQLRAASLPLPLTSCHEAWFSVFIKYGDHALIILLLEKTRGSENKNNKFIIVLPVNCYVDYTWRWCVNLRRFPRTFLWYLWKNARWQTRSKIS